MIDLHISDYVAGDNTTHDCSHAMDETLWGMGYRINLTLLLAWYKQF